MTGNLESVRLAIAGAVPIRPVEEPEPPDEGGGGWSLPAGCPVTPLGVSGNVHYYADALRQFRELKAKEHTRLDLMALFGTSAEFLYRQWPRLDKEGQVTGWRPEAVAEALMRAAAGKGVIDIFDKVRGAGAWLGPEGELVLHCGDRVLAGERWLECGQIGAHFYPAEAALPRPDAIVAPGGDKGPAFELLSLLRTWSWARPELDAQLLLGWIGSAIICGALKWRPAAWVTGDAGTGKSTLHEVIKLLFDGGLLHTSDTTAAAISQTLGHKSLPIEVDELEAEEDNRRSLGVVQLARQAASGGLKMRGGADHKASTFTLRSSFLFSSILVPPLQRQDRSRIAILELLPLSGATAPKLDPKRLKALGAALRRRFVDHWPRFAPTLERYRQALAAVGHGGRGADQYGTLLACADLMLHDNQAEGCSDDVVEWAERLKASALTDKGEDVPDHERCVSHLMGFVADVYQGGRKAAIGELVHRAVTGLELDAAEANTFLGGLGLRVARDRDGRQWLLVANSHGGIRAVFDKTHWAGKSGATGVYVQALRRVPGAKDMPNLKFNGVQSRSVALPIEAALGGKDEIA